jgi:hypothetical protein
LCVTAKLITEWQKWVKPGKPHCEQSSLLAKRVRLIDNMTLRTQLASLERRVGAGDRETVSHPQHASAHDDVSCAACGALAAAAKGGKYRYDSTLSWVSGDGDDADEFRRQRLAAHILRTGGYYRQWTWS